MSSAVAEVSSLFELYRTHYGQPPAPAATRMWVGAMARSGALDFYGAYHGAQMVGFASVHEVPASLGLGRFWQLRDLFVDPSMRRRGVARLLVQTVRLAATEDGALRLSLQTEPENVAALALYRQCGFTISTELTMLSINVAR